MSERYETSRQIAENWEHPTIFPEIEGEEVAHMEIRQALENLYENGEMDLDECLDAYKHWLEGYYG